MIKYRKKYSCEKDVKEDVKKIFKHYGVWYFMPSMNGFGRTGIPDFVACVPCRALKHGVFVGIETKYGNNKPTEKQLGELNDIKRAGGFAYCINEKDLQALEKAIQILVESK